MGLAPCHDQAMDGEIWGLIGVGVGAVASLGTTLLTQWGARRAEVRRLRESDDRLVLGLCADAYVDAVEATLWLNNDHVEDSVNPRFAEDYAPKTDVALEQLRRAKASLRRASALGQIPACKVAAEVAITLGVLENAWNSAQDYRRQTDAARSGASPKSPRILKFYEKMFDQDFGRLLEARKVLTGFEGHEGLSEVYDAGGVLPGSLLARLQDAASDRER
jgi:hypothetical protein